ncbi:MAG: DUF5686 and carboxypeptidase regulatory-like domain-containing protein [Bacteroidota bacterium]
MQFRLAILLCLLWQTSLAKIVVTGTVLDNDKSPLPFASVYVNGTTRGTTSNENGLYAIEINETDRQLVFRYIGYKTRVVDVVFDGSDRLTLDVLLEPESFSIQEIVVKASGEDPAYAIIRKAISNRKKNANQAKTYTCNAYVKGLQRLTKYPKKLFGQEIRLDEFIDTASGIVYLSESVSKLEFDKPNLKETMISSKVSGNSRAFSFNQASEMEMNIYDNIINIGNLSPRGFISPISPGAMVYYDYRFDGSYMENGFWVNRIEIIPKRKSDPVFSGFIYIQNETWRVQAFDLMLTKDAQIQFVDTLHINQIYIPTNSDAKNWMPGSVTYNFSFGVFGFVGNGRFVAAYSEYDMNPSFDKKHFSGEVLKIEKGSNEKDSIYWDAIRPVPLTDEEERDYSVRDSTQKIKESKEYLDSLDHKSNKFNLSKVLTGYVYNQSYRKTRYEFPGLIENLQYNTVEGANVTVSMNVIKNPVDNYDSESKFAIRYGFANEKPSVTASHRKVFNPHLFGVWSVAAGDDLLQFNGAEPISPLMNTSYTLFDGHNYMKLYRKQFAKASMRLEPINGLRLNAGVEYAMRTSVKNNSFESWSRKGTDSFTVNNPPFAGIIDQKFPGSSALIMNAGVRIRFKQQYVDRPDLKYVLGSKYPYINIQYTTAIPHGGVLDPDYGIIRASVEDRMSLGMAGSLAYQAIFGKFLYENQSSFMDIFHFNGNRTIFSEFNTERFDLLDYYSNSTNDQFMVGYVEHAFGGLLLNKIPMIRKLKLNEVAGIRMLQLPGKTLYTEFSFGLEKLGLFRADFVLALDGEGNSKTGFVFGIKRSLIR